MFKTSIVHAKRLSFASRLFPKLKSASNLLKDVPAQDKTAEKSLFCGGRSKNKDLLTFFGTLCDFANGNAAFGQLPTFRRSLKKLTHLVELELEHLGAQEVLLPSLVPQKLWQQSGRLQRQHDALDHVYSLTDRAGVELLLGPTFEESITYLVNQQGTNLFQSELPLMLYQTSTKFRYESNPKFGLIRSNEFIMNDLYSFDADLLKAEETYARVTEVYERIFNKLGLNCMKIQSDPGSIGGKFSHEYQLPLDCGQDVVLVCSNCNYAFNDEMCRTDQSQKWVCSHCGDNSFTRQHTLELGHTFLLSDLYSKALKSTFLSDDNQHRHFQMGCFGLGMTRILAAGVELFSVIPPTDKSDEGTVELRWPSGVEPYKLAIITPAKRSKQFQAGSTQFTERVALNILDSTNTFDILIEDRDKEGIGRRLDKIKSFGIPNIIVIGNRFIQDQPELEVQTLDVDKQKYSQTWMTEELLMDYIKRIDL